MQFKICQACNKVKATDKTLCIRGTLFRGFRAEVSWLKNMTDCNTRKSVHTLTTRTGFLGIRQLLCNPKVHSRSQELDTVLYSSPSSVQSTPSHHESL